MPQDPNVPDSPTPDNGDDGLPEELAAVFRGLTGGADLPPEMVAQLKAMGLADADPAAVSAMAQQVRAMFTGPVHDGIDPETATTVARQVVAAAGDRAMTDHDVRLADQAGTVATLWLDEVTDLEAPGLRGRAWSRAEWVEATLPVWADVVAPLADGVAGAMTATMRDKLGNGIPDGALEGMGLPAGIDPGAVLGQIEPMMRRMGTSLVTAQLGQAVGTLASDLVTATEVCLPLVRDNSLVLLPDNITAFADGLGVDIDQVWLYLAVREAARLRLFHAVPWLGPQILTAVQDYARGIAIDTDAIEEALGRIDPTDAAAMQEALGGSLFRPEPSPAQKAALSRLETWLALAEGWVDVVTARATAGHLPQAEALAETVRRRRATGGPTQKAFAGLVGLDLRPRRLRDAANLFAALEEAQGREGRDAAWAHPDVAPTSADLDDVLGYAQRSRTAGSDIDAELDALLRGDGEAPGGVPGGQE
ncbi:MULTISPECIES: zinc-dependent metalloprotease [unclassified Janibacter]|uniref:zinc-dependent metalloprotease n=1 Tax=unclassified Janibacter TaxID=2649294 RepID=UPI003D06765A